MSLEAASTPHGDTWDVPAGWRQGRGAYGGLVVATLARAIDARIGDPSRPARSLTAEVSAPVEAGAATIAVDVLRAGNAVTTARAALSQAGEVRAHAVALLAAKRPVDVTPWQELEPPRAPAWADASPPSLPGNPPEFAAHFDYRLVEGIPGAGGAPRCVGWIRPREPGARRDTAYIAALIDAWWPAVLVRFGAMRPMGTIAFTLDVLGDPGDGPLLYRGTVPVCGDGYFIEDRELWTADGRLVALNRQTFAIIR
jgi:hypothetical protein